jgi:hypothetical protein
MSLVEKKFNEAMNNLTGQERVRRTVSFYHEWHQILTNKYRRLYPDLPPREIQIKVAQQFYLLEKPTLRLLEKATRK